MRSKSPLVLIEQIIIIAVFALAAALCLQAFVWADLESARNADADRAALYAQTAAELLKGSNGDYSFAAAELGGEESNAQQEGFSICYDSKWDIGSEDNTAFTLSAKSVAAPCVGLESAEIEVADISGSILISFKVNWQED